MENSRSYRDLIVWKKSIKLTKRIYSCTQLFPKEEMYGIISQMRRAAVSIASNIAEGQGRGTSKEFLQFLNISRGSLYELETQLFISQEVGYLAEAELNNLLKDSEEISRLLNGLMNSLR
ncbi:MAG: four helix bundle protein [Planctomycetaceae bacterium]|nr:four helix bundle protein [Planctomycetaceae bacterium]